MQILIKGLFVYDLGELWYNLTGKPFVFALWLIRKEAALSERRLVSQFYKDLLASKKRRIMSSLILQII